MAGFRISYRLSLIVAIPLLVVGSSAIIAGRTFLASRAAVAGLTDDLFREISQKTADKTRTHLARAIPAVDLLTELRAGGVLNTNGQTLHETLVPMLRSHRSFTWVSWSSTTGEFWGATREADGKLRLNHSRIINGKTALDESDITDNNKLVFRRHQDDTGYDPRTRPFYVAAATTGERAWTDPYLFFDSGVPGISCSMPVYDAGHKLAGVFTVDFDLNMLSDYVARLKLSPSSKVFVFTADGKLLADPFVRVTAKETARAASDLATITASGDSIAIALFNNIDAGALAVADNEKHIRFVVGDQQYMGSVTSFEIEKGSGHRWLVGVVALESDFQGPLKRTVVTAVVISVIALFGALVLAILLARQVSLPLSKLATDMAKVGRFEVDAGDDDPSIFVEIYNMQTALHKMKGGLRSFANYVPRDLVRTLVASGVEAKLGGETQQLTVFFSDLAGFTTLSESLPPSELVARLGRYFDDMTQTIASSGGTVDKFIGDGIMAFWGAPIADADHATNACLAALRCQEKLRELESTPAGAWLQHVSTRIGIATGEVLVGNIGTPTRMNYTVMGDTANLAARLESLSKQYGTTLLAEECAVAAAEGKVIARPVDLVAVKGRARGARVYELLGIVGETDDKKIALVAICRAALDHYMHRRFTEAADEWSRALTLFPDDRVSIVMRNRALGYVQTPPPESWDGVYVATQK